MMVVLSGRNQMINDSQLVGSALCCIAGCKPCDESYKEDKLLSVFSLFYSFLIVCYIFMFYYNFISKNVHVFFGFLSQAFEGCLQRL